MKRLLALDGGGIRGVFTLCILERMESLLREKSGKPDLTLSDHFHYIGGTSTGAIIAAFISWGIPTKEIKKLYIESGAHMFARRGIFGRYKSKFHPLGLTQMLQEIFSENGKPVTLETDKLKTFLLVVTRNATTGSSWPITNNPRAMFNREGTSGNNMKIPLWQLVRASTAAPTFFPPEKVTIYGDSDGFENGVECSFEDGGVTPYNNPSFLLYLKATLPQYRMEWPTGEGNLHLVSIGTGYEKLGRTSPKELNLYQAARTIPKALMQSYQQYQDLLCRHQGRCIFGAPLDLELGDMITEQKQKSNFTYVRYNHTFTPAEVKQNPFMAKTGLTMDDIRTIPFLEESGSRYAKEHVASHHLR